MLVSTPALTRALAYLASQQLPSGGWRYVTGQQPFVEPTCYALLALRDATENREQRQSRAIAWLDRISTRGPVSFEHPRAEQTDTWGTILSYLTLSELNLAQPLRERFRKYILATRGNELREGQSAPLKLEGRIQGWLWSTDTTSWVEPTSYALLALKKTGFATHPRVVEGVRYLRDRACYDGGWNYGNKEVLKVKIEPWPTVTAYALLALQDLGLQDPAVAAGWRFLESELAKHQSSMTLSLAILTAHALGRPFDAYPALLEQRQDDDGSWRQNVYYTALAALALQVAQGQSNPFQIRRSA